MRSVCQRPHPLLQWRLRARLLPPVSRRPSDMMATVSASRSASSMKCVVSTRARPARQAFKMAHKARLEAGSTPAQSSVARYCGVAGL